MINGPRESDPRVQLADVPNIVFNIVSEPGRTNVFTSPTKPMGGRKIKAGHPEHIAEWWD